MKIVNEIQETPKHNRFQADFLKMEYRQNILKQIYRSGIMHNKEYLLDPLPIEFEICGWDVLMTQAIHRIYKDKDGSTKVDKGSTETLCIELKPTIGDDFPAILRQVKKNRQSLFKEGLVTYSEKQQYRQMNDDGKFSQWSDYSTKVHQSIVEMRKYFVLCKHYNGLGASVEEVDEIFMNENIFFYVVK